MAKPIAANCGQQFWLFLWPSQGCSAYNNHPLLTDVFRWFPIDKQCQRNTQIQAAGIRHSAFGIWQHSNRNPSETFGGKFSSFAPLCTYNQFVVINSTATPSPKKKGTSAPLIFDASCARLERGKWKKINKFRTSRNQKIANIMATLYNPLLQQIKIYDSARSEAKVMCMLMCVQEMVRNKILANNRMIMPEDLGRQPAAKVLTRGTRCVYAIHSPLFAGS